MSLFASGRVVDLVLVVMIVEAALLLAWRRRTAHGPRAADLIPMLVAGACLLLALRVALVGGAWPWIAVWLLLGLAAHLLDLARRWRN